MPITEEQIAAAEAVQHAAGRDAGDQVRLVAGPGTGKSSTIEERVRWLLEQGTPADAIVAVSFTRASAFDLRGRIQGYCLTNGQPDGADVAVSTLHSLALRTLRRAGALNAYAADPLVMDDWELRNIFEAEFGQDAGIGSITRREAIRRDHEAFWSTGMYDPPDLIPPEPPISETERDRFRNFHRPRTQLYSCVLPGELIRQCVARIEAGTLDPADLLGVKELIVDEFQDLNPMDLRFVDALSEAGVRLFVAGDDDQSLYSFRFASPSGIQEFTARYPGAGDHALEACFRCTPAVVRAATQLIEANAAPTRIPKSLTSLYEESAPPLSGALGLAAYRSGRAEAVAVAMSCTRLIDAGFAPSRILILLSNQRAQGPDLFRALEEAGVPFERPREASFRDEPAGRLLLALLRVVTDTYDYVAHRTILGLRRGVGVSTCNEIARASIDSNLNFRNLFYASLPDGVFSPRAERAVSAARDVCDEIAEWSGEDAVADRDEDIRRLLTTVLRVDDVPDWDDYRSGLPDRMTLEEIRSLLLLDKDEQQAHLMTDVYRRLDEPIPADVFPPKVRIMSMHGAKGLSSQIVFIPGLEEEILPGPWRRPYPGLVLEAARMLYVSITRARLACILTYAETRFMNGRQQRHSPSRFTSDLGRAFSRQQEGITEETARALFAESGSL